MQVGVAERISFDRKARSKIEVSISREQCKQRSRSLAVDDFLNTCYRSRISNTGKLISLIIYTVGSLPGVDRILRAFKELVQMLDQNIVDLI